jgi:alpha-1,6-mannosyltransferase
VSERDASPGDPVRAAGDAAGASAILRSIRRAGIANALCFVALVIVAWGLTGVVPAGAAEPLEGAVLERWADRLAVLGDGVSMWVRGQSALENAVWLTFAYAAPLVVSCLLSVYVLSRLSRATPDAGTVEALLRWAIGFAVIGIFALPVLVQDFWLSAGWGRLVAHGQNPYYVGLDPGITQGLPLDYLGLLTTYGPLWTLLAGAIMKVSGPNALAAGILFKLLLAGAWIGSLLLLRSILRDRTPRVQCAALVIAGWLPIGVVHAIGDGHNDVVMAFLVMLWLWLLMKGKPMHASLALAASVVIKYLSAPLFLVELIHAHRVLKQNWRAYLPRAIAVAILGLGVTAVFFRDMAFFASTRHMSDWHFFTPRSAVTALGRLAGVSPGFDTPGGLLVVVLAVLASLAFLGVGAVYCLRFWRNPSADTLRLAVLGCVGALLFGVVGHVWPWFLVWGLLSAALAPDSWLARWTVGIGIGACFVMLPWVAWPGINTIGPPSLALCAFALLFSVLAPRSWFGTPAGL